MIRLVEELTQEERFFTQPTTFMFAGHPWKPGLYTLYNLGGASVTVNLFTQKFTVAAGTKWRFMVHPDLESFQLIFARPVGRQYTAVQSTYPGSAIERERTEWLLATQELIDNPPDPPPEEPPPDPP